MNINRIIIVLICLLNVTNDSNAQITNKMIYSRTLQNKGVWYFATRFYGFNGTDFNYVSNDLVKLYGEDSLKDADNIIKLTHTVDSLHLWDIQGIAFVNDSQIRVYGTYYIKSYEVGADVNKKVIIRENEDGAKAIMKVFEDETGRKYIKKWHIESYIDITEHSLTRVEVINKNKWFYTEKERNTFLLNYQLARYPLKIGYGVALIAFMAYSYQLGK